MHDIALNELWTLVAALLTIGLGTGVIARVPVRARYSIAPAVVGGFLVLTLAASLVQDLIHAGALQATLSGAAR